jgi:hypothetical protein
VTFGRNLGRHGEESHRTEADEAISRLGSGGPRGRVRFRYARASRDGGGRGKDLLRRARRLRAALKSCADLSRLFARNPADGVRRLLRDGPAPEVHTSSAISRGGTDLLSTRPRSISGSKYRFQEPPEMGRIRTGFSAVSQQSLHAPRSVTAGRNPLPSSRRKPGSTSQRLAGRVDVAPLHLWEQGPVSKTA